MKYSIKCTFGVGLECLFIDYLDEHCNPLTQQQKQKLSKIVPTTTSTSTSTSTIFDDRSIKLINGEISQEIFYGFISLPDSLQVNQKFRIRIHVYSTTTRTTTTTTTTRTTTSGLKNNGFIACCISPVYLAIHSRPQIHVPVVDGSIRFRSISSPANPQQQQHKNFGRQRSVSHHCSSTNVGRLNGSLALGCKAIMQVVPTTTTTTDLKRRNMRNLLSKENIRVLSPKAKALLLRKLWMIKKQCSSNGNGKSKSSTSGVVFMK